MGNQKPTVCLDFDGVLNDYVGAFDKNDLCHPKPGVTGFLKALGMSYKVVIHTTRQPIAVRSWLLQHKLDKLVDRVMNTKPPAIAYLDDRAVCFRGDFGKALYQIRTFKAHWEK